MFQLILRKLGIVGAPIKSSPIKPKSASSPSSAKKPLDKGQIQRKRRPVSLEKRDDITISRKEHVPNYVEILSYADGEIALNSELEQDYVVLLTNKESRQVIIICSVESAEKNSTDNNYLTIKSRCEAKKYSVKKKYATRQLIQLIYESDQQDFSTIDLSNRDGLTADFDRLLSEAISNSVSDIHIEVRRTYSQVRFRRHGELALAYEWTAKHGRDLAGVIYQVLADEKEVAFIEAQQQSAKVERLIDGKKISIRLNTIPDSNGFDMVMRLLTMEVDAIGNFAISDLGYRDSQIKEILFALSKPVGVIIISGTTGSGKSVSMSTFLNGKIRESWGADGPTIKVITVEDPTEYLIAGATQCGVVRKKGNRDKDENPFAESIRAAVRCDPDILMVGEVRDRDSAKLLMGAVQSGHTALTTVHASSSIGIVGRLRSMDVPNDVLGSNDFISALIYQSLLQVTCRSCGITWDEFQSSNQFEKVKSSGLIDRLEKVANGRDFSKLFFRNYKGCDHCVNGVSGRTVVAEIIIPTPAIRAAIAECKDNLALYHYLKGGGTLIIDHGIEKVFDGISDPRDVEKALGLLTSGIDFNELAESLGMPTNIPYVPFNQVSSAQTFEILKPQNLDSELFKHEAHEEGKVVDVDFSKHSTNKKDDQ